MKVQITSFFIISFLLGIYSCSAQEFIRVKGTRFYFRGAPYQFVGSNYWYGGLLSAVKGKEGEERLRKELDFMKANGVTNLRTLVGAEGIARHAYRVPYSLQPFPGKLDENLFKSLDFFLVEAGKREMKVVLYLTNNWDWSGGLGEYLYWNGYGAPPLPGENFWDNYGSYLGKFFTCEACKSQYYAYIEKILCRKNAISNKRYKDDPTIMSWEIANEPRPMSAKNFEGFSKWISGTASLIRSLDKNHLITSGSEGEIATDYNIGQYVQVHRDRNIDYLTIHVWPKNWGWFNDTSLVKDFNNIKINTRNYIDKHLKAAIHLNKPLVIEEFGLPRDGHSFDPTASTVTRDNYYRFIYSITVKDGRKSVIAGTNFWGMAGYAKVFQDNHHWKPGNDFTADPGKEEQGLNSVFVTDSTTWNIIKYYSGRIDGSAHKP